MNRKMMLMAILGWTLLPVARLAAHCEVPCGIYGDQRRFEEMLEDQETIAKADAEIATLVAQMQDGPTPLGVNQVCRWVDTKETHATRIQQTIAQYFMAQRIKADDPAYAKKLAAAHAVMVAAMKAKQDASSATAGTLKSTILTFQQAYGGK